MAKKEEDQQLSPETTEIQDNLTQTWKKSFEWKKFFNSNWQKYRYFILSFLWVIILWSILFFAQKTYKIFTPQDLFPKVLSANFDLNYRKIPFDIGKIDISFSKELDPSTITNQNFKISPSVDGNLQLISGNTIRYSLTKNLEVGKEYTVTVSQNIKSLDGKKLDKEYTMTLEVVSGVKVLKIVPEWDVQNLGQNIAVFFNMPVVPLTNLDKRDELPCPLEISPNIEWKCKWTTTSVLEFIPQGTLSGATEYTIKVIDKPWLLYPIKEWKEIKIKTPKLKLSVGYQNKFRAKDWVPISFNFPVDINELKSRIIFRSTENINGKQLNTVKDVDITALSGSETNFILKLKNENFIYSQSYDFKISWWIKPKYWNINLTWDNYTPLNSYPFLDNVAIYQKVFSETGFLVDTQYISLRKAGVERPYWSNYDYLYLPNNDMLFYLTFEEPVDLNKANFDFVSSDGKSVDYNISYIKEKQYDNQWNETWEIENKQRVRISLKYSLSNNKVYKLIIKKSLSPSMKENIVNEYKTSPKLKLTSFRYLDYNKSCFYFNNPISYADMLDYLDPKAKTYDKVFTTPSSRIASFHIERDIWSLYQDLQWLWQDARNKLLLKNWYCPDAKEGEYLFELNTRFNPYTKYTINLSAKIKDRYGNQLGKDFIEEVETKWLQEIDKYLYTSMNKPLNVIPSNIPIVLDLQTINMEEATINICQMDISGYLDYKINAYKWKETYNPKCLKEVTKKLPVKKDYWNLTNNRFDIENDILGENFSQNFILVRWSINDDVETYRDNKTFMTLYVRSNLALWMESAENKKLLFTTNYSGTEVVNDLNIVWYNYNSKTQKYDVKSLNTKFDKDKSIYEIDKNSDLIVAQNGNYFGILDSDNDGLSNYDFGYNLWEWTEKKDFLFLYTDRPIYKPWDTVYFKWILRQFTLQWFKKAEFKKWKLSLIDPNYASIKDVDINIDDNSNFNGSFTIPKDVSLGEFRFKFAINTGVEIANTAVFSIEEYKTPTFKVEMSSEKKDALLGESIDINVAPTYYFGGKMINAKWQYSVLAQDYYFDAKNYSDYQFGNGYDYFYCLYWGECSYDDEVLEYTGFDINSNGEYMLKYEFPKDSKMWEKIYSFSTDVTDPDTQKLVSASYQVVLHKTDGYVWIQASYRNTKKSGINVKWITLNTDATGKWNVNLRLQLIKLDRQVAKKQDVDGIFYNDYSLKETVEQEVDIKSNNSWLFESNIISKSEGEYKINAIYTWTNGQSFSSSSEVYVAWDQYMVWDIWNNDKTDLVSDKMIMNVWDTQEYTLKSPVNTGKALIVIEKDDGILDYFIHDIKSFGDKISIPIKEEYYPNIYVKALLIWSQDKNPLPIYKRAISLTKVSTEYKNLKIELQTDKQFYKPREKVKLNISVKDNAGNPVVNANWSIAVVDESVLALKWNPKKNPYAFFYDMKRFLGTYTYISLKNLIEKLEVKDMSHGEKWWDGENIKWWKSNSKRWIFKDTAFWKADFTTDANGNFSIETDALPDNLTTWDIEVLVNTPTDNKVGIARTTIITNKKVMISDNLPRFLGSSDKVVLSPVVFNKTGKDGDFTVSLSADNLNIKDPNKKVFIKNWDQQTVPFEITINDIWVSWNKDNIFSRIDIKATNTATNDEDEIEKFLQIKETSVPETVATVGKTDNVSFDEHIDLSSLLKNVWNLKITFGATLMTSLLDGIDYLNNYPYGCAEQKTSVVMPNVYIKKLYDAAKVPSDLKNKFISYWISNDEWYAKKSIDDILKDYLIEIKKFQNPDGWFVYWYDIKYMDFANYSDFGLTSYILSSVSKIRDIGYTIDESSYNNTVKYLKTRFYKNQIEWCIPSTGNSCRYPENLRLQAIDSLLTYNANDYEAYKMRKLISLPQEDNSTLSIKTLVIAKLIKLTALSQSEKDDLKKQAIENVNKVINEQLVYNPKWAFIWKSDSYSRIQNTSRFIQAVSEVWLDNFKDIEPIIDNCIRRIMSQKQNGSFGTTQDNIVLINALTSYLNASGELNGVDLLAKINLNDQLIADQKIDDTNKLENFSKNLAINNLQANNIFNVQKSGTGNIYYDLTLSYYLPIQDLQPRDEWFAIIRHYYDFNEYNKVLKIKEAERYQYLEWKITFDQLQYPKEVIEYLNPITSGSVWQLVIVYNKIITNEPRDQIVLEWYVPSGSELVNVNLNTESSQAKDFIKTQNMLYFPKVEYRTDRLFAYRNTLDSGIYSYSYIIRLTHAGSYNIKPTMMYEFYNNEVFGRTAGELFEIK